MYRTKLSFQQFYSLFSILVTSVFTNTNWIVKIADLLNKFDKAQIKLLDNFGLQCQTVCEKQTEWDIYKNIQDKERTQPTRAES